MKKRLRSILMLSLVAGSLVFQSCGETKKDKEETTVEEQQEINNTSEDITEAEFNNATIDEAFKKYILVKDALVQTDAEATAEAAKELEATLTEENSQIAKIAARLSEEQDVNVQREIFSELTAAMDPVLKGAISSGKIYKQYCPMAFEGKGDYWYATSEEIRNPYYGDKMLKCGRVDETIQ
ncbi:DUF3347 domain-containing protein [uncultured Christiangramia sp.]|uniref:DUF3347 domain-containing protein n=1 Tax=uncultured Christiangramia sp. TaxID=503836 RepID=UPI0026255778|nr:DUF3347 domain-containing protein [uncultured Christiangramia sp.]